MLKSLVKVVAVAGGVAIAAVLAGSVGALAQQPPLKTAVDGTFAPHAFPDLQNGGIQGFNVDLAKEIARFMKREITIDAGQYSALLPALQAGTYDFVIAPTTVTKERAENFLFPEGYLNTDFQFIVKKGAPEISKLEDLAGKVVSVNRGSAYETWANDRAATIGWKVEPFGTQTDALQAVQAGRADANVAGNTVQAWAVKQNPQLKLSYLFSTGLVWSAPVRKDNPEMRAKLETAIECLKKDGTIAKLHEKWFGQAPAPGSAAVTIFPGTGVPGMPGYDPAPHPLACG